MMRARCHVPVMAPPSPNTPSDWTGGRRLGQGCVRGVGAKSGQRHRGYINALADLGQHHVSVAAALVLLEAENRHAGPARLFGELVQGRLGFVGPQKAAEAGPAHADAAVPERRPVVLGVPQGAEVGVFDAGLAEGLSEAGLAEARLAADRVQPDVGHDIDPALDEGSDEGTDVPSLIAGGPQPRRWRGRAEEVVQGDFQGCGQGADREETWLDRTAAFGTGEGSRQDSGLLRQPLAAPASGLPEGS